MTATSTSTNTLSPEQVREAERWRRAGKNSHQIAKVTGLPQEAVRAIFPTPPHKPRASSQAPVAAEASLPRFEERAKRVKSMREAGLSNEQIAQAEGISTDRISRIVSKARTLGYEIPKRGGPKPKPDHSETYRQLAAMVNAGKTLAEIIAAFPEQSPGHTKKKMIAMKSWALQNGVHVSAVANNHHADKEPERTPPVAEEPPDASSDPFAHPEVPKRPDSHWAWVANRCCSVYGPEAVAKTIGCETSQLQLWNHGSSVPNAKFQEALWRVLVATIAHDHNMTGEDVEDLHEKLLSNVKSRLVGWRGK